VSVIVEDAAPRDPNGARHFSVKGLFMFVQVIKGKVKDPQKVRDTMQTWLDDLSGGATGWLGSTTGVTDDGTMIAIARFDSVESAQRNSDRPEQGEWWAATEQLFDGEATFDDSTDVDVYVSGDPDSARFVQVIQGEVSDSERAKALMRSRPENFEQLRPDILAILTAGHRGGRWTSVAYFTSESEARQREAAEPPPEFTEMMAELRSLNVGEMSYYNLERVWLDSPVG